jgi:uncharacterized membrane protein
MEDLLQLFGHYVALALEAFAIIVIAAGALEAAVGIVRVALHPAIPNSQRRTVWLKFARWLVAGLTFQLAADIVGTSFEPTWDQLARLGLIAVIRTFLSFFLDRELDSTRDLQHERQLEQERSPGRGRGGRSGAGGA